jgi:hypothetical protein
MEAEKRYESFRRVWARVEAAGRPDTGPAKLMPRKENKARPPRPRGGATS